MWTTQEFRDCVDDWILNVLTDAPRTLGVLVMAFDRKSNGISELSARRLIRRRLQSLAALGFVTYEQDRWVILG